jgi:hypothetical protein
LADIFGTHRIAANTRDYQLPVGDYKIIFDRSGQSLSYRRFKGEDLKSECVIMSEKDPTVVGIFPNPPLFTPQQLSKNVYVKFRVPVVVDQNSEVVIYAKIPIELGVYRQADDEEMLIDSFSLTQQRYALYGPPESGVVCRYIETDISTDAEGVKPSKYQEAHARIKITNGIDNVIRVSKVIIPIERVIIDHAHDDAWLTGSVEMTIDSSFGRDIVIVHLAGTKVKPPDKTSLLKKEETKVFMMDSGY